jgi:hypothetical protein
LPTGRYRIDYPARAPYVPAHIKPLRVKPARSELARLDNLLGSTAAEFFALPGGLKKLYAPRRQLFQTRPRRRKSPGAIVKLSLLGIEISALLAPR